MFWQSTSKRSDSNSFMLLYTAPSGFFQHLHGPYITVFSATLVRASCRPFRRCFKSVKQTEIGKGEAAYLFWQMENEMGKYVVSFQQPCSCCNLENNNFELCPSCLLAICFILDKSIVFLNLPTAVSLGEHSGFSHLLFFSSATFSS